MSNGLDQDQDQHSVGPDLGPNCLQRQVAASEERVNYYVSSAVERKRRKYRKGRKQVK